MTIDYINDHDSDEFQGQFGWNCEKSEKIENGGRIKKNLIFLIFVWLGVEKWIDRKREFV